MTRSCGDGKETLMTEKPPSEPDTFDDREDWTEPDFDVEETSEKDAA